MKVPFVDLHAQYLGIKAEIDSAIGEVIAQSAFIRGKHVDTFEQAWVQTLKVKHCISCANGTDALYVAMRGLGLKAGDEVITTAHSWIGTFGDAATFSFYPGKNLGAYGDAGCIVTNDDTLADWTATFARHGGKGEHVMEGINSRMDGLQAAILNVKLPHLPAWTTARRRVAARYNELLSGINNLTTPKVAADRSHVYHLYIVASDQRDLLRKALADSEITTSLNYP